MQEGNGPIHIAALGGYENLVDLLCQKYGVDPTGKNKVNDNKQKPKLCHYL